MKKILLLLTTLLIGCELVAQLQPQKSFVPFPSSPALAAQEAPQVSFVPQAGAMALEEKGHALPICVDAQDWPGVHRAAQSLAADIGRVTGTESKLGCAGTEIILIGTLGHSPKIDELARSKRIDVEKIRGKWEATVAVIVEHPMRGVKRALVIAGSDKRGTIYGAYDLSAAIGVSPWYWWADVPAQHHEALYLNNGWFSPEPAVRYRGIFLNDEAPSLSGWVNTTYGGYNHHFYEHVFELLLRLHSNFLWPAMWNNAFNEDDPLNPKLADEYGIVMGTSHHEPMLRAQQEWKRHGTGAWNYATNGEELRRFWTEGIVRNAHYESAITLGMRGDGDMPMSETENVSLLEHIVADQRKILVENSTPELAQAPKVWALYKEVQGYYERGMRVPDDVTLLWCDDNWGNIRRLPTPAERARPGGAGIYYHFDYVGGPRSYKWLNTYPLPKIWEQMHLALRYDARRIWIVNVGDLKPMELPISFFLYMARQGEAITPESIEPWTQAWAAQQFGGEHSAEIASLLERYTRYNGRRKPEQLEPSTWSLTHDGEANRVDAEWRTLAGEARALEAKLPEPMRPAFFELVRYPVEASAVVNELYISAGRSQLWATQGRSSANAAAIEAARLFARDAELSDEYNHRLLGGKWAHMMDQTHIGYTYWNQPPLNVMPPLSRVQPLEAPQMGIAVENSARALTNGEGAPLCLQGFDSINRQSRAITVFNMGTGGFDWQASTDADWVLLSESKGHLETQQPLQVKIDWDKAPVGLHEAHVRIAQSQGPAYTVVLQSLKPEAVTRATLRGFFESFGVVSIEAAHTSARRAAQMRWIELPGYGETLSAMTLDPPEAASATEFAHSAALDYNIYFTDAGKFTAEFILAPTLQFVPSRGLRFAISVDGGEARIVDALEHNADIDWERVVSDGVRHVAVPIDIPATGEHTLTIHAIDPGVVLEKIVLRQKASGPDAGVSYLGPPESFHGE